MMPELRFPEFEGEWEEKKLGEILSFKNGVNAPREKYGKGYKFINVLDIIENDFITHERIKGAVDVSEDVFKKNIVEYGDILFQRSSETREDVGQSNVYLDKNEPAIFGGFVIRGKKIEDYFPVFMNYLLKTAHSRKEITTKSGGSTRYNVGQVTLSNVKIITTHKPEQTKIATFLTAVDKRINLLQKKKTELTQYKKGVMQKLFSQEIRFKQDDGSDKVNGEAREGSLGCFPGWEEKKLGDVAKIKVGGDVGKLNFSKIKTEIHKFPVYANALTNNSLYGFSEKPMIKVESVTVTGRGDVGFAFARKANYTPVVRLLSLIPLTKTSIYFLKTAINLITIYNESTGVPQLTAPQLAKYKIYMPCYDEQQKIADFLSSIDKSIEKLDNQIEHSQKWKQGLLQKMFV